MYESAEVIFIVGKVTSELVPFAAINAHSQRTHCGTKVE
jgi:hypothetical protein